MRKQINQKGKWKQKPSKKMFGKNVRDQYLETLEDVCLLLFKTRLPNNYLTFVEMITEFVN